MSSRMRLGIVALVLAALVACGEGGGPLAGSDETARRDASQALEAVDELRAELEAELDDLAGQVDATGSDEEKFRSRMSARLDHLAKRLDRALARLGRRLDAARGAGATADSALAEARSVARALAILDERLDYHLKNHGGR